MRFLLRILHAAVNWYGLLGGVSWASGACLILSGAASAREHFVTLQIELDSHGRYDVHQVAEQFNRELGAGFSFKAKAGERRRLSAGERLALVLADESGVADVQFEGHRITIRMPRPGTDPAKERARALVRRCFGVESDYDISRAAIRLPDNFDPQRQSLLLIHGLEGTPTDFARFEQACQARNVQLLTYSFPNDGPLELAGRKLQHQLQTIIARHPKVQLVIIGYSMGGLVARYALESPGGPDEGITDLFLLGTPNQGSRLAEAVDVLETLVQLAPRGPIRYAESVADGLGEAADDLAPGSDFLRQLNQLPRRRNVTYHVGLGTRSFLTPESRQDFEAAVEQLLSRTDISPETGRELLKLVRAQELADGDADGAVTRDSASLDGVGQVREFALNHRELIALPGDRPEESEVFQWILGQLQWTDAAGLNP